MKAWFENLSAREQIVLSVGVFSAICILLFQMLYLPIQKHNTELRRQIASKEKLFAWMRSASEEVNSLKELAPSNHFQGGERQIISQIAATHSVSINRLNEERKYQKLQIDNVEFNRLLKFLDQTAKAGLTTQSATINALDKAGRVEAKITLKGD